MPTLNQLTSKRGRRYNTKKSKNRAAGLEGCPFKKGLVSRVLTMKPKKPNSAQRKIARVKLSTGRKIICFIPGIGHNLREYSDVLVRGGQVPDLPGIQYKLVRGKYDFNWKEDILRCYKRSKYGIPREDALQYLNENKTKKLKKRKWWR